MCKGICEACFDLEKHVDYYLVWAEFTTGDSFGSTAGNLEIIDIFTTQEKLMIVNQLL